MGRSAGRGTGRRDEGICVGGEKESIFTSPLSSRCILPPPLPHLLETILVRHSAGRDAKLALHPSVGVSLRATAMCIQHKW